MTKPKSNAEFLRALFGDGWTDVPVASNGKNGWSVKPAGEAVASFAPTRSNYYCVSIFDRPGIRRKENFVRQNILVVDDIGTKLDSYVAESMFPPPTYKLETSPGNFQWGFLIDGGCDDARKMDAVIDAIVRHGLLNPSGKDPGMANVTRVVRLPFGANEKDDVRAANGGKPWPHVLHEWAPKRAYALETLAEVVGADLSEDALDGRKTVIGSAPTDAEIEGDFILAMFRSRGMIVDESRNDAGFITVECPWRENHTDGRTEAGYRPGLGGFRCHHGHCDLNGMNELRAWAAEAMTPEERRKSAATSFACDPITDPAQDADLQEVKAKGEAKEEALLAACRDFVYVVAQDRVGERLTGRLLSRSSFNAMMTAIAPAGAQGQNAAFARFMNAEPEAVDNVTYAPGGRRIVTDKETGERLLNRWRRGPITPFEGKVSEADLSVYLNHVALILHDDKVLNAFLDWAAYLIQNPGKKINWAFVLIGGQGVGKDLILTPIARILGSQNCRTLNDHNIESQFNDWLENQLLIVAELPSFKKKDFYDRLKMYLSTGQDRLSVNRKNMQPYPIRNFQNWFLFSNHIDALAIEHDDRRVLVFKTEAEKQSAAYFDKLTAAIKDEVFLSKLYRHLLDRDVRAFKPFASPPMTEAKRAMIEAARDPLHTWLADLFEEGGAFHGRRLITPGEIAEHARPSSMFNPVPSKLKDRVIDEKAIGRAMGDALRDMKAERIGRNRVRDGKGQEPVWAIGGKVEMFKKLKELKPAYDRDVKAAAERRAAITGNVVNMDEDEEAGVF